MEPSASGLYFCPVHQWCHHPLHLCKNIPYSYRSLARATVNNAQQFPPLPPAAAPEAVPLPQAPTQPAALPSPALVQPRPRPCIYCSSTEHTRWQCPKVPTTATCWNCGARGHLAGSCSLEFSKEAVDQNRQRFFQALGTRQAFVPLQAAAQNVSKKEEPEYAITVKTKERQWMAELPQPTTMKCSSDEVIIKFDTERQARDGYRFLQEKGLKLSKSWEKNMEMEVDVMDLKEMVENLASQQQALQTFMVSMVHCIVKGEGEELKKLCSSSLQVEASPPSQSSQSSQPMSVDKELHRPGADLPAAPPPKLPKK